MASTIRRPERRGNVALGLAQEAIAPMQDYVSKDHKVARLAVGSRGSRLEGAVPLDVVVADLAVDPGRRLQTLSHGAAH